MDQELRDIFPPRSLPDKPRNAMEVRCPDRLQGGSINANAHIERTNTKVADARLDRIEFNARRLR